VGAASRIRQSRLWGICLGADVRIGFRPCQGLRVAVRIPGQVGELSVNPLLCAQNAAATSVFEHNYDDCMRCPGPAAATERPPVRAADRSGPFSRFMIDPGERMEEYGYGRAALLTSALFLAGRHTCGLIGSASYFR
jgi:hypothetical protein